MTDRTPDVLDIVGMEGTCPQTINGWLWYCDEHNTHGNADSEDEAHHYAQAHQFYFAQFVDDECDEDCEDDCDGYHSEVGLADEDAEICDVLVWQRLATMDDGS